MRRTPWIFLLAFSLHPLSLDAHAAGLITGLAASANPVRVNQDVTFTVKGTSGGCGDLTIDYGDGQTTQLVSVSFNNNTNTTTPPHKYGVAKTYLVKAIPGKSCTGSATVSLAVTGGAAGGVSGGRLATGAIGKYSTGLSPGVVAKTLAPQIETVFLFSVISPGGGVIVKGVNFGAQPGQFKLRLQNGQETNLGNLTWATQAVSGVIDPNLSGVIDQPATLTVVDARGMMSNEVPVKFTARREIRQLPMADVRFDCSTVSDTNKCNSYEGVPEYGLSSFEGYHACTGIFITCNDAGDDDYSATVANGWEYSHGENWGGKSNSSQPIVIRDEPGSFHFKIHWDTVGNRSVNYRGPIYIEGPAGTSHK